ncbi:MAG TPA: Dabb family protein [Catalimonadaceae bacterium]|nr:Dabb family protein [Catalimonadaceae bacterium]HPI11032.1 Dabb family protein [Catalimonadaceae bacterium]
MKKIPVLILFLLSFFTHGFSQGPVTHLVLFKLKPGILKSDTRYKEAVRMLNALPRKIPFIADWSAGENFSTRPIAFDYGLHVVFDSKKDLQNYLTHPAHVEAANAWKEIAEWNIADYEEEPEQGTK